LEKLAVLLLSGGMDSAVTAAIAKKDGYELAALHLNYGQRTQERELECYNALCEDFGITKKLIVDISYLKDIGGSSLTDNNIQVTDANLESNEIPNSYVPFRNGNILAIAASWAEVINAEALYIGAVSEDSSGYPDTRPEFFEAMEKAINLGNKPETNLKIITPIIHNSKKEIAVIGTELGVNFANTWSCYKSNRPACGVCDSCALRLRGFRLAGLSDPIEYEK